MHPILACACRSLHVVTFWLAGLTLAGTPALTAQSSSAARSPWSGVWEAKLGDYGILAFDIRVGGDGQPTSAATWWLVDFLRPAGLRVEDRVLQLDLPDHQGAPVPGLALRLTDTGTLRLEAHGVLSAPLDPLYQSVEFTRPRDSNPWYRITNNYYKTSEWGKWHETGTLKPLPATWPASVTVPLLQLFRFNDHLLTRVVVLPSLPETALTTAFAWTREKPRWNGTPEHIQQRIAQNLGAPVPVLTEIWNHPDNPQLWIAAAQHPRAPAAWSASLIDRIMAGSDNIKSRATWGGGGPPELYLRLIAASASLRRSLASNRDLPAVVYERLARDYPAETVASLASNPAVPLELIASLAATADRDLQLTLINNPALPPATRTQLVRQITAQATPADFARFVHDRDAPPDFLVRTAEDLEPGVRTYTAQNANAPEALLLKLAEDPSRLVAAAARESLQKRFPSALARHRSALSPLDPRPADIPLSKQFDDAAVRRDLDTLRRLALYFRERNTLESALTQAAGSVIRDGFRPEVMDFFIEQGFNRHGGALSQLAGVCGGDRAWLEFFKTRGAFQKTQAATAYAAALDSRQPENLAGLLSAGIDPNQPSDNGRTALHRAVLLHDFAALEALLRAGANPLLADIRHQTPLDYAVQLKFIPAIRRLDQDGRHAALVQAFVKEFPPAPKSRFLGGWTNNRDGFYTVAIQLNADGSGQFGAAVVGGLLAWREVSATEAVAFPFNAKGEVERSTPIALHLDPAGNVLTFVPPKGETQKMIRSDRH
jgi:hypothetical protein